MFWDFAFTDPMIGLLQAGQGAQDVLLRHISDPAIQDQVVMLFGGVGNEQSIWPIIETLTDGTEATMNAKSKRLNLIGDPALTNLTVSEVIWHQGGGSRLTDAPTTRGHAGLTGGSTTGIHSSSEGGGDRLYVNYPNYGIYAQFDDASMQYRL
jgi:hypothetical protein